MPFHRLARVRLLAWPTATQVAVLVHDTATRPPGLGVGAARHPLPVHRAATLKTAWWLV